MGFTFKYYFVSKLFLSVIWNSITDITIICNILCKRRNKSFYDVLTFIPNQDTVHCEPPWWKTTSTWNLMLNDPILNVLFLCFMSLTLTPTKVFFVSIFFFAECKRSPLWSNCHCQNVPSGQPPKVRMIKIILKNRSEGWF